MSRTSLPAIKWFKVSARTRSSVWPVWMALPATQRAAETLKGHGWQHLKVQCRPTISNGGGRMAQAQYRCPSMNTCEG